MKVFLGGTCNESLWREEIKSLLKVDYFDPVVNDWNRDARDREKIEKEQCQIRLYTITSEMTGVFSIAEAIDDANKRPDYTVVCILDNYGGYNFKDKGLLHSMEAFEDMLLSNNVRVYHSLQETANYINNMNVNRSLDLSQYHIVFLDSEFTSLSQNAKLISIGMTDLSNNTFYSEVIGDYSYDDCSDWVKQNIIPTLKYNDNTEHQVTNTFSGASNLTKLKENIFKWFENISSNKKVLIISDCLAYDWILFAETMKDDRGEFPMDKIFYVPVDIMGVLMAKGIDIDVERESLVNMSSENKHDALHDAIVIKEIFKKYV